MVDIPSYARRLCGHFRFSNLTILLEWSIILGNRTDKRKRHFNAVATLQAMIFDDCPSCRA